MNTLVDHRNVTVKLRDPIEDYVVCVKCKGSRMTAYTNYSYYNPDACWAGGLISLWVGGQMECPACRGRGYWKASR